MGRLLARATAGASLAHVRRIATVPPGHSTGLVGRVYRQMATDFGMLAPPVALHAAAPTVLAASWSVLRETMLATGVVSRADKETVAAAVSAGNRCPYCVDIHGGTLSGLLRDPDAIAVASDRLDTVIDARRRALASWARGTTGGRAPSDAIARFPAAQWPELVGVAVTFHYLNRMVNLFLQESPLPQVPGAAAGTVRRGASWLLARLASGYVPAGAARDLLPDAPLPADLSWARARPHIADALSRATAAIEAGAARVAPAAVRQLVTDRITDTAAGPGLAAGAWLDAALADLAPGDRPVGRLALLTALASYRVTDPVVDDVRNLGYDDAALVELTAWASWTAARRIGARETEPATGPRP
jgi:AhpD family alkylhydroperoxidase